MRFYLTATNKDSERIVANRLSEIGDLVPVSECDLIVSIGGDGTLLSAGKLAVKEDKPVVGINAGHLGYLCAFKIEDIDRLTRKDFESLKETSRTLIEYEGRIAINDICILKANPVQSIEVEVDNLAAWKGDGVIFSTATGSSSYNQSAGGPILDPESSDLLVTPVCPHFSKDGPKQLNVDEIIAHVSGRNKAIIAVDNDLIGPIEGQVVVRRSFKKLRLLTK